MHEGKEKIPCPSLLTQLLPAIISMKGERDPFSRFPRKENLGLVRDYIMFLLKKCLLVKGLIQHASCMVGF